MGTKPVTRKLRSYGGTFRHVSAKVFEPRKREQLAAVLATLGKGISDGKIETLSVCGTSNSLHFQGLPPTSAPDTHAVLVMGKLRRSRPEMTLVANGVSPYLATESWATWEQVLEYCVKRGHVPPIMPTSGRITVAGAIAAGGISRFSPVLGKMAEHVYFLRVWLPSKGTTPYAVFHPDFYPASKTARPPGTKSDQVAAEKENADLFHVLTAGHGLVGVILNAGLFLQPLAELKLKKPRHLRGHTQITRPGSWEDCVTEMVAFAATADTERATRSATAKANKRSVAGLTQPNTRTQIGLVFPNLGDTSNSGKGTEYSFVVGSRWGKKVKREERFYLNRRKRNRTASNLSMPLLPKHTDSFEGTILRAAKRHKDEELLQDKAVPFVFFLEFHTWVRDHWRRTHFKRDSGALQQTFVIPIASGHNAKERSQKIIKFLGAARVAIRKVPKVRAQAVDLLYLPQSDNPLAPTYEMKHGGMAITLGIERLHWYAKERRRWGNPPKVMEALAEQCHKLGGRLNLSKNAFIKRSTLQAMYSDGLNLLDAVRGKWDAKGVLATRFWEGLLDRNRPALTEPSDDFAWADDIVIPAAIRAAFTDHPELMLESLQGTYSGLLASLADSPLLQHLFRDGRKAEDVFPGDVLKTIVHGEISDAFDHTSLDGSLGSEDEAHEDDGIGHEEWNAGLPDSLLPGFLPPDLPNDPAPGPAPAPRPDDPGPEDL